MLKLSKDLITKYDVAGPRYTSYPTAPQWQSLTPDYYKNVLHTFGKTDKTLSIYVHIPFCKSMCYYCGCSVLIRKPSASVGDDYLDHLSSEIALTASLIGKKVPVKQLHLGGGTPTFLTDDQLTRLVDLLKRHFDIDFNAEVAIEIDPRTITADRLAHLKTLGFNRLSFGVQDFDPVVQKAINRTQPVDMVADVMTEARKLGFSSINMDLIYGLPYQTPETIRHTIGQVVGLKPDRIAFYSYAHIPWLKSHQTLMDPAAFPTADQKLDLFFLARQLLTESRYAAIGMDHFALETDELATAYDSGVLYRNFMGYTVKPADEYIGFGITSIGFIENTFIQNTKELAAYNDLTSHNQLPVTKGMALSEDDRIRRWVIQSLMCRFKIDKTDCWTLFEQSFDTYFSDTLPHLAQCEADGLITGSTTTTICVTELGKIFIRNVCMGFDAYLKRSSTPIYSKTI